MRAEQQYIDLFSQCEAIICQHSAEVLKMCIRDRKEREEKDKQRQEQRKLMKDAIIRCV